MIATATFVPERMAGRGRQRDDVGHRPRRVARRAAACRSARPTPSSARSCAAHLAGEARRCATSSPPTTALGPDAAALVAPGVGVHAAHVAGRRRARCPVAAQLDAATASSLRRQREALAG